MIVDSGRTRPTHRAERQRFGPYRRKSSCTTNDMHISQEIIFEARLMVKIQILFRGAGVEVFQLPEVPRAGDFVRNAAAGVYCVAAVLWQPAAMVKVFAVPVPRSGQPNQSGPAEVFTRPTVSKRHPAIARNRRRPRRPQTRAKVSGRPL